MHFTSCFAIGVLAALTTAAPADQEVLKSSHDVESTACSTKLPTSYQLISRDLPKTSFQPSRLFEVSQVVGGVSNTDSLLRFSGIPPGSFGCQLAISFTANYPITSSGSTQVNIYGLLNDIRSTDTYSTYFPNGGRGIPKDAFLFGTTTINGLKAVINSQVCRPNLAYLIEIASDTKAGRVTFVDAGKPHPDVAGFYLTYNC